MAPPSDRRPGFSRRAQYGIFTGYVIAILGVLAGLALLVVSLIDPGAFSFARGAAGEVARPLGAAGATTRTSGLGFLEGIADYFSAASKNAAMREELELARADAVKLKALEGENERLKRLLGIIDPANKPVTAARLIGSTAASTRRIGILSEGSSSGVGVGMPVRSATGLIGRIIEVGPNTARVLLVTDSENVVPVRGARGDIPAFVQGNSDGRLVIRLINMGVNPIRKGDVFVTSGSGGLYPPGIPVAVAVELTRDGALAHIVSDPSAAEFVIVEPVFQPAVASALDAETKPSEPAAP